MGTTNNKRSYIQNYKSTSILIENIKGYMGNPIIQKNKDIFDLFNIVQFALLLNIDLNSATYNLIHNKYNDQYKFSARIVSLIIYEGIDDLSILLGGRFNHIIHNLGISSTFTLKSKELKTSLEKLKKKHSKYLKLIRINTIAHNDHNTNSQFDIITRLDRDATIEVSTEFTKYLNSYFDFALKLFRHLSNSITN